MHFARKQIRWIQAENRSYGSKGLFADFRLSACEDESPSAEERPHVGAFVPLEVAARHPELLVWETLESDDVETKPRKGRVELGPGRFETLDQVSNGCIAFFARASAISASDWSNPSRDGRGSRHHTGGMCSHCKRLASADA